MKSNFSLLLLISVSLIVTSAAKSGHVINFRSPTLYPESLTFDPKYHNFIVGGTRHQKLLSVSISGFTETLISGTDLPENSSFLGLAVDRRNNRLLACIHRIPTAAFPSPFNALAAYDLQSRRRIFLTPLLDNDDQNPITTVTEIIRPAVANDVTVDFSGNAYITNSDGDFIWKVNVDGEASILSRSEVYKSHPVDVTVDYHKCGLNGIVYISKGYLLVVQSNTGKMYKVNVNDGTAKTVNLDKDLTAADGMAVRSDGVVVVVSHHKLYYVKTQNNWDEGVVFDEIALDVEGFATGVIVGERNRVYVLYGHVMEGIMGNGNREEFSIVEIEEEDNKEDNVWLLVLVGFGLTYFLFWRFQMRRLVQNMDKRIA
ncbi:hypothetical protein RND71_008730 [Anisodus tanguticus]|uniref:SMP-30/Gluconolactonase/LRE-like region domain-containing protein n=1 Tax=Anisodus tanguticus TaxID=243964 RepID=A0AAE1VQZ9_9SOLA|nr:hypothetical protein RND71_008730 [Anisodus tanguticus]